MAHPPSSRAVNLNSLDFLKVEDNPKIFPKSWFNGDLSWKNSTWFVQVRSHFPLP